MNGIVKGQTLRVQGEGFNAIAGNPLGADGSCAVGSGDVSNNNCCRKKTKANVCEGGSPPAPPSSNSSQCVALLDPSAQWRPVDVTSVSPSMIIGEIPGPSMLCIGDAAGYDQKIRVAKRDSAGGLLESIRDYCRNS
jgi:hypothetical protein